MDSEARFARYIESLASVLGHADRAEPLKDYCTGLLMPVERKSVEPMAAMVVAGARVGGASVAAAFCRAVGVVGRGDAGQGQRSRGAGVRSERRRRGVDRRRHGISEEGLAFRGRGAPILRTVGQDGQLPDRGDALAGQPSHEPADRATGSICRKPGRTMRSAAPRRMFPRT